MRSGVMWRLVLFVLAVGNDPVQASGVTRGLPTDDKVGIHIKSSALLLGSCPKGPGSTMNVRLQSLKTKSGTIFRRKVITDDEFACMAASGSQPLAAGNILECSKKAEVAGLEMFRWNGGNCTGYPNGIPMTIARCAGAGSVVLYSVDAQAKSPAVVVSNITFAFSSSSTINATWDVTPKPCFGASYRVSFNNISTTVLDKLATVGLGTVFSCAEYPLTVTQVDAKTAAVMGTAATVKVVMPKALELSLNLTHGVTVVKASWRAEYTCNPNKHPTMVPIKSYSVKLGAETGTTDHSTFEFTFQKNIGRCIDSVSTLSADLNEVTCMALDDTSAQIGNVTATVKDNKTPGHRYVTKNLNCVFYQKLEETSTGSGLPYLSVKDLCQQTMFSNLYIQDGALDLFIDDLTALKNFTRIEFFLGLELKYTKWMWLSGNKLTVGQPGWDAGEPDIDKPVTSAEMRPNNKIGVISSTAENRATFCFDNMKSL